jgi:hypothetical protein
MNWTEFDKCNSFLVIQHFLIDDSAEYKEILTDLGIAVNVALFAKYEIFSAPTETLKTEQFKLYVSLKWKRKFLSRRLIRHSRKFLIYYFST